MKFLITLTLLLTSSLTFASSLQSSQCKIYSADFEEIRASQARLTAKEDMQTIEKGFASRGYIFVSDISQAGLELTFYRIKLYSQVKISSDIVGNLYTTAFSITDIKTGEAMSVIGSDSETKYFSPSLRNAVKNTVKKLPVCRS